MDIFFHVFLNRRFWAHLHFVAAFFSGSCSSLPLAILPPTPTRGAIPPPQRYTSPGIFVNFCAHAIYAAQRRNCKNQTEPQNTKNLEYGQWPEKMHKHFCSLPFLLWAEVGGGIATDRNGSDRIGGVRIRGAGAPWQRVVFVVAAATSQLQIFGNSARTGGGLKKPVRHVRSDGWAPHSQSIPPNMHTQQLEIPRAYTCWSQDIIRLYYH